MIMINSIENAFVESLSHVSEDEIRSIVDSYVPEFPLNDEWSKKYSEIAMTICDIPTYLSNKEISYSEEVEGQLYDFYEFSESDFNLIRTQVTSAASQVGLKLKLINKFLDIIEQVGF